MVPKYDFAKFSEKLHEIEKILGHGGAGGALVTVRAITGRARLIRTRLIRSCTLFEVSVKYFPIIFLSFYV